MSEKLTPWFPGDVKPARVGFYQRKYAFRYDTESPDYWNGFEWELRLPSGAFWSLGAQSMEWRGLAKKPSTTKDAEVSNG